MEIVFSSKFPCHLPLVIQLVLTPLSSAGEQLGFGTYPKELIQCTKPEGTDSFGGQVVAPFCPSKGLQQP